MPGAFNPLDSARTVSARPAHVNTGDGLQRWYSDLLFTRPKAQDFNFIFALFRNAMAYFSVADTEGDDTILQQLLLAAQSPGRNYVRNPSFDLWQAGTSFVTTVYTADLWKGLATAGRTISRQAGFSGARYCYRLQRDAGDAVTTQISLAHVLSPEVASQLAGKLVTLSADVRVGANYSGATSLSAIITSGTGIDEIYNTGPATFPTGSVSSGGLSPSIAPSTTAQRIAWASYTVPAGIAELAFRISYLPTGIAGAADYLEITNVKLEVGGKATRFEFEPISLTLATAMRYYQKSFYAATTPAQAIGAGAGEFRFPAARAGALINRLGTVQLKVPMRVAPTITIFNPTSANSQVRDIESANDCSSTSVGVISDNSFALNATGHASTIVGNVLGYHWVADARAF